MVLSIVLKRRAASSSSVTSFYQEKRNGIKAQDEKEIAALLMNFNTSSLWVFNGKKNYFFLAICHASPYSNPISLLIMPIILDYYVISLLFS